MIILLDIDGVLVTIPAWRKVEILEDGFMKFNEVAVKNLAKIIAETDAEIVLTTTHRINHSIEKWNEILKKRGIYARAISKVNKVATIQDLKDRATEIQEWIEVNRPDGNFVIIDDDSSINNLPSHIKSKCVVTKSMIGLDEDCANQAITILLSK